MVGSTGQGLQHNYKILEYNYKILEQNYKVQLQDFGVHLQILDFWQCKSVVNLEKWCRIYEKLRGNLGYQLFYTKIQFPSVQIYDIACYWRKLFVRWETEYTNKMTL